MAYEIDILSVCCFCDDDELKITSMNKNVIFCSYIKLHLNEVSVYHRK